VGGRHVREKSAVSADIWKNVKSVLSDPRMARAYAAWWWGGLTGRPRLRMDGGFDIGGFRHFSEFWGASNGRPTPSEVALVRRHLGEGRVALDVGANIGVFALTMAALNSRATVHAFEPVASNYERLVGNVELNRRDNVLAHHLAVAEKSGMVRITSDDRSPATNRISTDNSAALVESVTLDDFCAAEGIAEVDLVKIDVEGAEPLVLRGASSLLARRSVKSILIEICPANLALFGFDVGGLSRPLREAGYSLHRLGPDGGAGAMLRDEDLRRIVLENVVALPG
jgi:FkbM family methyltransferase